MKYKFLYGFLLVVVIISNVLAELKSIVWLEQISQVILILFLTWLFRKKLPFTKLNFLGFSIAALIASITSIFVELWLFHEITMGLWLACFLFLIREGLKYTQYNRRNRYLHLYFFVVVAIYIYLFSLHILEIEESLSNNLLFSMFLIYYFNLFILGSAALIYYLNSFSRKAVFFTCLALAFILSDVLRDMGDFYFRDLSVEVVGSLIKLAGIAFTFLFFVTKERKLRLLNLV